MIKSPQIALVYDRKKMATNQKTAPVEIRIIHDRKVKYLSTGVKLLPKEWNGRVVSRLDCVVLQERLDEMVKNVQIVINEMMKAGNVDLNEIPSLLKKLEREGMTFIDFCEEKVKIRTYGLKDDTAGRYERFMSFFRNWGKIVWFSDLTEMNILLMDEELDKKNMKAKSKWHNYHRFLNSFIIDAINEGMVRKNPYKAVRIDKGEDSGGLEKYLTKEEFKKICKAECPLKSVERARDLFVFQVWTCLAYVDLADFDAQKIKKDSKGRHIYMGKRHKTGHEFTFMLMPEAMKILEKYNGKLPVMSNQKYNDALKMLSVYAKVKKVISSHWARHTGATLMLNAGVDMEIVAKVLGHSSTKITREVYAKILDSTVADAMEKIADKMSVVKTESPQ